MAEVKGKPTAEQGLMLKDNAGNVYYLRPELLEAAKVPAEMAEKAQRELKQGESKFTILGPVKATAAAGGAAALPSSTIMCPW